MAHFFRTGSVVTRKKPPPEPSSTSKRATLSYSLLNGAGNRHHTMRPQARDSVLSNGSSDRSSSISDEALLSPPTLPCSSTITNDFFSSDIDERIQGAWPVKCCFVVKEIMQTELAYVQSLGDIIKGYLTPLYSHLLKSGESPNFVKTVFSNIVKIHQAHLELMECFQDTCTSPHEFGSSFLHVDFLGLYTVYCTSYPQGNDCLDRSLTENANLRDFIEQCQHQLGHSLPLSSQLIKPVQRILKYRLLLEELNKHFDPQHSACETIQNALEKMSTVAEKINTSFTKPKVSPKGVPSAVAKKRMLQVRDLQMSRSSLKSKKCHSSHNSPTHVHPVSRCTSETQLNTISVDKKRSHDTLPSEGRWGSHMVGGQRTGIKDKGYTSDHTHSPRVQSLRNYFENLTKEEEVEEARRQSIGSRCNSGNLRRVASLGGTRKINSINNVGLVSPTRSSPTRSSPKTSSPKRSSPTRSPSKSPKRKVSITSLDLKFFGGGEKKKKPLGVSQVNTQVQENISVVKERQTQEHTNPAKGRVTNITPSGNSEEHASTVEEKARNIPLGVNKGHTSPAKESVTNITPQGSSEVNKERTCTSTVKEASNIALGVNKEHTSPAKEKAIPLGVNQEHTSAVKEASNIPLGAAKERAIPLGVNKEHTNTAKERASNIISVRIMRHIAEAKAKRDKELATVPRTMV